MPSMEYHCTSAKSVITDLMRAIINCIKAIVLGSTGLALMPKSLHQDRKEGGVFLKGSGVLSKGKWSTISFTASEGRNLSCSRTSQELTELRTLHRPVVVV